MDRLTHRYQCGGYWASIFKISACGENECKGEIIDRLAEYENSEEQGLLVRLPCKVGGTVYTQMEICSINCKHLFNSKGDVDIWRGETNPVCIRCDRKSIHKAKFELSMFNDISKTVFLTRADAEKALAEMEAKNG